MKWIFTLLIFMFPKIIFAQTTFSPYGGMMFLDNVFNSYCITHSFDNNFLKEDMTDDELKIHNPENDKISGKHIVYKNIKFIGYNLDSKKRNSCTVAMSTPDGLKKILPFRVNMENYIKDKNYQIVEIPVGEVIKNNTRIRYATYSLSGKFGTENYGKQKEVWYVSYILLDNEKSVDPYLQNQYTFTDNGIQIELTRILFK